jgi:hypothetical protein
MTKKLFLIAYKQYFNGYMSQMSTVSPVMLQTVWADDSKEAERIVEDHVSDKGDPHGDSYYARVEYCVETLGVQNV